MSTYWLYRHFDEAGRLLYVGITIDVRKRTHTHMGRADWSGDIRRIEIEPIGNDRRMALDMEREAIRSERPLFNQVHSCLQLEEEKIIETEEEKMARILKGSDEVAKRGAKTSIVFNEIIDVLRLKNDATMARAMEETPAVISKLRKGVLAFSPLYIVKVYELMENHGITGWSVREIKARLGLRRVGDPE